MNRDEVEGKTAVLKGKLEQATVGEAIADVGNAIKK